MWFMNAAGNWPGRRIDSNSGDKIGKFLKPLCRVKVKKRYLTRYYLNCYTITLKRYLYLKTQSILGGLKLLPRDGKGCSKYRRDRIGLFLWGFRSGIGLDTNKYSAPQRFKYSTHSPTACLKAKKKDAWRLAQAVILFLATYLMSSGPILVFF
jgi:hypothetical protein